MGYLVSLVCLIKKEKSHKMLNWLKRNTKWATYFILGASLIAVYKTFDSLNEIWSMVKAVFSALEPFILAFVIAYMLNIPSKKLKGLLDKKVKIKFVQKHSCGISVAVVFIISISIFIWIIGTIVPALLGDFVAIYQNIPSYAQNIADYASKSDLAQKIGFQPEALNLTEKMNSMAEDLISVDLMKNGIKAITSGIWSFASGFMKIFIALIASVYMLLDKERILSAIHNLAAKFNFNGKTDSFIRHWTNVNEIFTQYIYSRLICCAVMAVACTIILAVMGEEYALLLGIFIGFMDLIPYFGSIISWAVGLVVMVISGGWSHGLWCSFVILIMQQLDGNVLAPKVTGDRLEIRPLTIIIAVSVGGSLFGFAGMLISVPVVAIIRAILSELIEAKVEQIDAGEDKTKEETQ